MTINGRRSRCRCWTFRALTDDQLIMAELIFDEFRDKELKPAYLADADPNRALLDRRVVCDLLGFDEETYVGVRRLAAKWCAEPSVHGGKSRPRGVGVGGVAGPGRLWGEDGPTSVSGVRPLVPVLGRRTLARFQATGPRLGRCFQSAASWVSPWAMHPESSGASATYTPSSLLQ